MDLRRAAYFVMVPMALLTGAQLFQVITALAYMPSLDVSAMIRFVLVPLGKSLAWAICFALLWRESHRRTLTDHDRMYWTRVLFVPILALLANVLAPFLLLSPHVYFAGLDVDPISWFRPWLVLVAWVLFFISIALGKPKGAAFLLAGVVALDGLWFDAGSIIRGWADHTGIPALNPVQGIVRDFGVPLLINLAWLAQVYFLYGVWKTPPFGSTSIESTART
jgi:hypothetical protein